MPIDTDHVLPSVVGLGIVRSFLLDFCRQVEKPLGYRKLGFNLFNADAMIDQGKEARIFRGFDELACYFIFARLKVCAVPSQSQTQSLITTCDA